MKERAKGYWGHGGAIFPETLSVFGLFPSSEVGYGCDKRFGAGAWPAGEGSVDRAHTSVQSETERERERERERTVAVYRMQCAQSSSGVHLQTTQSCSLGLV